MPVMSVSKLPKVKMARSGSSRRASKMVAKSSAMRRAAKVKLQGFRSSIKPARMRLPKTAKLGPARGVGPKMKVTKFKSSVALKVARGSFAGRKAVSKSLGRLKIPKLKSSIRTPRGSMSSLRLPKRRA